MQKLGMRVVNNGVAGTVVGTLGTKNMLTFGQGRFYDGLARGGAMTLSELAVGYFQGDKVLQQIIAKGDWYTLLDYLGFNTGIAVAVLYSGLDQRLANFLNQFSMIPAQGRDAILTGLIGAGARTLAEYIDESRTLRNTPLKYVVHPTMIFR